MEKSPPFWTNRHPRWKSRVVRRLSIQLLIAASSWSTESSSSRVTKSLRESRPCHRALRKLTEGIVIAVAFDQTFGHRFNWLNERTRSPGKSQVMNFSILIDLPTGKGTFIPKRSFQSIGFDTIQWRHIATCCCWRENRQRISFKSDRSGRWTGRLKKLFTSKKSASNRKGR